MITYHRVTYMKKIAPNKIDMPKLVTHLNQTPIFEWHKVWCGSEKGYQKGMCLK